jgi:hypothetical protein
MEGNGQPYKLQILGFFSQALGFLKWLEVQLVFREKITLVPRLGYVWIPVDSSVKHCCAQFYRLEFDIRIKEGDRIWKIAHTRREFHMLCWVFCTDIYDR